MRSIVYLINLPTFPKGVLSLGIPAVAAALSDQYDVKTWDLNIHGTDNLPFDNPDFLKCAFIGLSVSAQNHEIGKQVTEAIKLKLPTTPVVWGGEFPTLLPEESLQHATAIVKGSFEPIADTIKIDLLNGNLKSTYEGKGKYELAHSNIPDLNVIHHKKSYYRFMGLPVETSRGCDKRCTFCMVHVMQSKHDLKPIEVLTKELSQHKGEFVNVVDYNIGVSRDHILQIAEVFEKSEVLGWMTELCLESLDDDEVLDALKKSRCRIIYCGLESLDEDSLKSINKAKTNHLENYERIIKKVQSRGIQIAAGLILGLEGTGKETFDLMLKQFSKWGIIYTKLTFLTYNPGTKVKTSMLSKGSYTTDELSQYDGNHLTFLPNGIDPAMIYSGGRKYISGFYGISSVLARSAKSGLKGTKRLEFILFSLCYRKVYMDWLKYNIFESDSGFETLLKEPFRKSLSTRLMERLLHKMRLINYRKDVA